MQNLPYLFAAYAIVWLVLFGYLFVLAYVAAGATYWTAVAFGLG